MTIGDVIIYKKRGYHHYSVYIGNNKIIHYSNINLDGNKTNEFVLSSVTLDEYNYNIFRILHFNKHNPQDIATRVLATVDAYSNRKYSYLFCNCAHFVCDCILNTNKFAYIRLLLLETALSSSRYLASFINRAFSITIMEII